MQLRNQCIQRYSDYSNNRNVVQKAWDRRKGNAWWTPKTEKAIKKEERKYEMLQKYMLKVMKVKRGIECKS